MNDTHTVRRPGKPDMTGESTYFVDTVGNHVAFLYIESGGCSSRGTVESLPEALLFPDTPYVSDGEALIYRGSHWRETH